MGYFIRAYSREDGKIDAPGRSKYQSKWCSNQVALTIYVNANELHFSPTWMGSRARHACTCVWGVVLSTWL